ncbi:hypothetical protein TcasGA2_TC013981 [Tribolium castaneum]|uniref:Uncharacterized protein n=1 Tax=Tribolium castaneum TaxID=7070 RepID=D6WIY3_TRICA|nr:hypothetical protein TcasGA2_TC013981 [Tribolium castaneum]
MIYVFRLMKRQHRRHLEESCVIRRKAYANGHRLKTPSDRKRELTSVRFSERTKNVKLSEMTSSINNVGLRELARVQG